MTERAIRPVRAHDAAGIAEVYAPFVRDTAITFDLTAPDAAEFSRRIGSVTRNYPWLVCADGETILGYAYADLFRARAAYRWVTETTVYVRAGAERQGIGRALYAALLDELTRQGFVAAIGCIALPNAASVAHHEEMGFVHTGTMPGIGHKFGAWHDVGFWQRNLAPPSESPPEPLPPFAR